MKDSGYWVVLRGKPETKQTGVCTSCAFDSKESFMDDLEDLLHNSDIVAVGISTTEAQKICRSVPADVLFQSALLESTTDDGRFHRECFDLAVQRIEFSRKTKCPDGISFKADLLEKVNQLDFDSMFT